MFIRQEFRSCRSYRIGQRICLLKDSKKGLAGTDRSRYWESEVGPLNRRCDPLGQKKSRFMPVSGRIRTPQAINPRLALDNPGPNLEFSHSTSAAVSDSATPELLQLLPLTPRWSLLLHKYSLGRRRRGVHPQFEMAGRSRAGTFLPPEGSEFRADIRQ
jgi:hypothetical protein